MKSKIYLWKIIFLLAIFVISSCSPKVYRIYQGTELPMDKIAVLFLDGHVLNVEIDGKDVRVNKWELFYFGVNSKIELLPGKHIILVTYSHSGNSYGKTFHHYGSPIRIVFYAKPGHTYELKYKKHFVQLFDLPPKGEKKWSAWIENITEKK